MKITDFNAQIAHREGKRQPLSIAQIAEVMAVADALLDGQLYALVRRLGCACENPPACSLNFAFHASRPASSAGKSFRRGTSTSAADASGSLSSIFVERL